MIEKTASREYKIPWTNRFIIHDDSGGPYLKAAIISGSGEDIARLSWDVGHSHEKSSLESGEVYALLVPHPKGVLLRPDEVRVKATRILELATKVFTRSRLVNILMRILLLNTDSFKSNLVTGRDFNSMLSACYWHGIGEC